MTKKERYEYRRANGLCVQCGKPITGKKKQARCAKCRREHNQHQRERREYLRKLGRCYECGRPLDEEGYTLCKKCREDRQKAHYARCNSWANRRSRKARKRRNSRVAEGMCEYCGKAPVVPEEWAARSV